MERKDKKQGTQAVRRAARVLSAIARRSPAGAGLTEVAQRTGLAQATTRRILRCLVEERLVSQDELTRCYLLGPLVYEFGVCSTQQSRLIRRARPALEQLAARTGDTVYLTARSGTDAVCLDRIVGSHPIRVVTAYIGDRRPLGIGAAGLAILARLEESEMEAVLRANAFDYRQYGLGTSDLRRSIALSVQRGYGFVDGLLTPGVAGIGLPILSSTGQPIAGISIVSVQGRVLDARLPQILQALRATIEAIKPGDVMGLSRDSGQGPDRGVERD